MKRRMLHLVLLVWTLALTTASAQDEVVLSRQITDPHGNPVAPGAVTAFDPFLSSRGTARTASAHRGYGGQGAHHQGHHGRSVR
ncbi:MAG: hypothetical protein J4F35_17255 [Candidatus Latescibacteria bacterium]|nr:hypothetical protein [Candidatus Latescibacterota bacterium]